MKIAICAIIKDEHRYLKEWINYHLGIGFSHIYLFEDYGSKSHEEIVREYEQVSLNTLEEYGIPYLTSPDGVHCHRQQILYEKAIKKIECDWLAFIDVDEFFEFEEGYNLKRLCEEFKDKDGVYLCWKTMTANGHVFYEDKPVRERFTEEGTQCGIDNPWTFKSFVNMNVSSKHFKNIHNVEGLYNTHGLRTHRIRTYKNAWLNHYFTKSWEEWCCRFRRGDLVWGHRRIEDFFDCNPDMSSQKAQLVSTLKFEIERPKHWKCLYRLTDDLCAVQTAKCGSTTLAYCCERYINHNDHSCPQCGCVKGKLYGNGIGKVFSVYRDPVDRFVSLYSNMVTQRHGGCFFIDMFNLQNATMDEFISAAERMLSNNSPYDQDEHIRRQIDNYPIDDIDVIVPIEALDDFLRENGIEPPPRQNVSSTVKPILTTEQEERIKTLYSADYEILKSNKIWNLK